MMSQDFLGIFPNQTIDGNGTECTALTVTDLVGNIVKKAQDPDFTYAYTLKTVGVAPNVGGADPVAAMQSAIVYGTLPATDETFTALTSGELYVANFQNYPVSSRQFAQVNTQNGIVMLDGFQQVVSWLSLNKGGVGIPMLWYKSFMTPNSDGTLPEPSGGFSIHMVSCFYADGRGLQIKPFLGANFGQNGYVYLPPSIFPQIELNGLYCYAFNPTGWRWLSLANIAFQHWNIIPDILPELKAAQA